MSSSVVTSALRASSLGVFGKPLGGGCRAAGGNFLAVWGPTAHSEFCGVDLCPDRSTNHRGEEKKSRHRCYANGRIDDAFAFGTPAAMDVYAASGACLAFSFLAEHSCPELVPTLPRQCCYAVLPTT